MKEIVALIVFLFLSSTTILLAVRKDIGTRLTFLLLLFSLVSGLAMANYDLLGNLRWEVPGLEVFRTEFNKVKEQSMEDLLQEAQSQRLTIQASIADFTAGSERLDAAIKYAEALLESIKKAEEKVKLQELQLKEQTARADQAAERAVALYGASADLALLLTKTIWLLVQARDDIDVKRRDLAVKQVMDQLDVIVGAVIEDPDARSEFVNGVMGSLPPRQ